MTDTAHSATTGASGTVRRDGAPGQLSLTRLARLSDFITAAALLILLATMTFAPRDLTTSEQAWSYISTEIESWITFVISFLIIAYYWINNQVYFSYYTHTDKAHTFLELIYLMCLAVMPFGNQFVGAHSDLFEAKLVASADIVLVGVMQYATWVYATRKNRLVSPGIPDAATRSALGFQALVLPVAAIVAAVAAYFYSFLWELVLIVGPLAATVRNKTG